MTSTLHIFIITARFTTIISIILQIFIIIYHHRNHYAESKHLHHT